MNNKRVLVATTSVLFGLFAQAQSQPDSLFIYSAQPISVSINNKTAVDKKSGMFTFQLRSGEPVSLGLPKGKEVIEGGKIQSQNTFILVDTAGLYSFFRIEPQLKRNLATSLSRHEVNQFVKVMKAPKVDELLEFMAANSTGPLNEEANKWLNILIKETVGSQTKLLEKGQNLTLAADLALSLPASNQDEEIGKLKIRLADYYLKQSRAALQKGRLAAAIESAKRSNSLYPQTSTAALADSLKFALARENVSTELAAADSLMKVNQQFLALTHYRIAREMDPQNEYLKARVDWLDNKLQDSLFQYAEQKDVKTELVLYRSMNYLNYLDRYPNGKYAKNSNKRLAKLDRISKQLSRYFIMVGENYGGIKGEGPAYSMKLGKFTERSIFFFGARMNPAGLEFFQTDYRVDKKNIIEKAKSSYAYAVPETGKSRYLSRGAVFVGVSKGVGKPGNFQFFLTGTGGIAWSNYWILTYKNLGGIQFIPEDKPAFRKYKEPSQLYCYEGGVLINYKMLCLEIYGGMSAGYLSAGYSIGLSF